MLQNIEKFIKKVSFFPNSNKHKALGAMLIDNFKLKLNWPKNTLAKDAESLKGRTQETSKQSTRILNQVLTVTKKIEAQADKELLIYIKNAKEALIREVEKLKNGAFCAEELGLRYKALENKAKLWLALKDNMHDHTQVIKATVLLLFENIKEKIDKDLSIIVNYKKQIISLMPISQAQQKMLIKDIQQSLAAHMEELLKLKEVSLPLEPKHLNAWKAHIDERRSILFAQAIQEIEKNIDVFQASPKDKKPEI